MTRVAVVTGAGSGVGRALSVALAARGWSVVLAGRREAPLHETAASCSGQTLVVPTDVSDPSQAQALVDRAVDHFSRVDALVNNAGLARTRPIAETDAELLRSIFAVNTLGPGYLIAAVWPHFAEQGSGRIVNLSTMGSLDPFPGLFAYAAAKTATESFVRSCVNEGGEIGVKAFAVAPGAVDTAMLRDVLDEETIASIDCLSPEDVATVVVECLEGGRDGENGKTIYVPSGS